MSTSYQSTDHSSSHKKVRQQLTDASLGISDVVFDLKKGPKTMQQYNQSTVKQMNNMLSSSINDVKKKQNDDISSVLAETNTLKSLIDINKKESANKLKSVESQISTHKEKIDSLHSVVHTQMANIREQIMREIVNVMDQRLGTYDRRINSVAIQQQQMMSNANKVVEVQAPPSNVLDTKSVTTLHIGSEFNMPKQPDVLKEGGIHKSAPLALSVNGAVVFHDIGYTLDKKNLIPLYYDPETNRVLLYHGK
jgi:hypothetical protein